MHLLEAVVDEAEKLDVDLVGLNQLMFATPREVEETLAIIGESDPDVISTHITEDPGLDPKEVPPVLRRAVDYAAAKGIYDQLEAGPDDRGPGALLHPRPPAPRAVLLSLFRRPHHL